MQRIAATGARAAMKVVGKNRGFLRTGGYYGRFNGGRRTKFSGPELKFKDTTRTPAGVIPAAGIVDTNFVVIPTGTGESDRIGRKVTIKSLAIRGTLYLNGNEEKVRMILVQDQQANGAVFTVANVLETADENAHYNLENQMRFKILSDQTFVMNNTTAVGAVNIKHFQKYLRLNVPIEYDNTVATTGAIATQRSNSIALLLISEQNNVTGIEYVCRVRYSDMG